MFRPAIHSAGAGKSNTGSSGVTNASPNKRESSSHNATANDSNPPSTIREIRSRTVGGTSSASLAARQLLANRRQAMSMERLNGATASSVSSSASMSNIHNPSDKGEKSSPMNGSSNSISGSAASSPSRGSTASSSGGLNRTASRVSRFRSAKAVFERLSSANSATASRPDRSQPGSSSSVDRPKGTVASRYAAAAAARGVAGQQSLKASSTAAAAASASPRSRMSGSMSSLNGSQANSNKSAAPNSPKQDQRPTQPRPQPRVITTATRRTPILPASQTAHNRQAATDQQAVANKSGSRVTPAKSAVGVTTADPGSQPKPPPKDLIDKIVLEIVRDAKNEHDANCTIQDLSNCDTSGIPETLDFDKCFQDVEMMTEEEARKLLSRKSGPSPSTLSTNKQPTSLDDEAKQAERGLTREGADMLKERSASDGGDLIDHLLDHQPVFSSKIVASLYQQDNSPSAAVVNCSERTAESLVPTQTQHQAAAAKSKVRFSDEPVTVYDTHAASDYDRRNDDIDPVAASAEYEIEKSRERQGIQDDDDEAGEPTQFFQAGHQKGAVGAVIESFNQQHSSMKTYEDYQAGSHTPRSAAVAAAAHGGDHRDSSDIRKQRAAKDEDDNDDDDNDQASSRKDYIESLEREVSIKRIVEQNLRDLQSQYYETVKQLDSYKEEAEAKISKLEESLAELNDRHESAQGELSDAREQSSQNERQLNDIKESSQLLEKKYHRAKRIIKDMQSREESFTRREQLYQQKLDEIEYELGVLIETIDRTIYEDGLKYFNISSSSDGSQCSKQHQTRLDVLGLLKRMMDNFNDSKKTQSAQIKQRIVTMLEQQLANLLANSNGCTSITAGPIVPIPPVVSSLAGKQPPTTKDKHHATVNNNNNNEDDNNKHNQSYPFAAHRLSQPNMPHPIGVGGQPTKIFHGLNTILATPNEPSPPQSVNSYPSTNSLNSLNNIHNNNNNNNNNNAAGSHTSSKLQDNQLASLGDCETGAPSQTTTTSLSDEVFQPTTLTDAQVPYQTNEWHDKPVSEWTTTQVSTWLLALGLDQYISKFEDRNVNGQSLINLDSTVLKGLGVLNSNDRNLLKKKIRELRVEMEKERKIIEKKMKENLKEKSKVQTPSQTNKQSWKKSLLS